MTQGRGFTIVEIVITITIMGILLTLAVVSFSSSEVNARDTERQADVESIGFNLENFYANKDPGAPGSGGRYPGTNMVTSETTIRARLLDVDPKSLKAPGLNESTTISLVAATNYNTNPEWVTPQPSVENDVYVYQPLTANNTLCTDTIANECRKYNMYYFNEKDGTVEKVLSKHQ